MKFVVLSLLMLVLCSCSNDVKRREELRVCLEDLATIGHSYGTIVSNVTAMGVSVQAQLTEFDSVERIQQATNLFLLKKGEARYLMVIEDNPPHDLVIACSAKPLGYCGKSRADQDVWVLETGAAAYVIYGSKIPPVPGCIYDSTSNQLLYPSEAVARFQLLYTNLLPELRQQDYKVAASRIR